MSQDRTAAFEEFARVRTPHLHRSAWLLCGNRVDAEDLVQETLTKVYVRMHRLLAPSLNNPAAYAQTTLTRTFISSRRRKSSGERPYADLPDAAVGDHAAAADLRVSLADALADLAPMDRAVLVLRYLDGLSVEEVAGLLDLTPGAVRNRSMRALARMRERSLQMKDDEFSKLLDESTRNLTTDVDALVTGGAVRGQQSLRRRRLGTAVAAAGLTAAVAVGVAVAPQVLGEDPAPANVAQVDPGFAAGGPSEAATSDLLPQPERPDREISVAARDIPALVAAEFGGTAGLGPIVEDDKHPVVETKHERIVHFLWNGTLTSVGIDAAHQVATCQDLGTVETGGPQAVHSDGVEPPTRAPNDCRAVDGLQVLVSPAYDLPVKAHAAEAWNHGYRISVTSYNVVDGKNPDGSEDVPPLMDQPALDMDTLIELVTSEIWFD